MKDLRFLLLPVFLLQTVFAYSQEKCTLILPNGTDHYILANRVNVRSTPSITGTRVTQL